MIKNYFIIATVTFCLVSINEAAVQIDENIQNKNVDCTIDLTTQLVKIQYKITLENSAKKDFAGTAYTFVVPAEVRENLAYISIRDALKKDLKPSEEKFSDGIAFTVTLASSSPTPVLNIETVFTNSLHPYPTHITQSERQLIRYFGNAYFYSPYKTVTQKTTIQLASKSVESYTTFKPSTQSENTVVYGPYENVAGSLESIFIPPPKET